MGYMVKPTLHVIKAFIYQYEKCSEWVFHSITKSGIKISNHMENEQTDTTDNSRTDNKYYEDKMSVYKYEDKNDEYKENNSETPKSDESLTNKTYST